MRKIPALFCLLSLSTPASAGDFACAVQPDGKSVTVSVTNPHKAETHCQVHCEFATSKGSTFMAECGRTTPAGVETVLCTRVYEAGQLGKLESGSVDCVKPLDETGEAPEEKEETAPDLSDAKELEKLRGSLPPEAHSVFDQAVQPKK